jgi:hypothetical protein
LRAVVVDRSDRFTRAHFGERDRRGGFAFEKAALEFDLSGPGAVGEYSRRGEDDGLGIAGCDGRCFRDVERSGGKASGSGGQAEFTGDVEGPAAGVRDQGA